jgi:hypothetical protein
MSSLPSLNHLEFQRDYTKEDKFEYCYTEYISQQLLENIIDNEMKNDFETSSLCAIGVVSKISTFLVAVGENGDPTFSSTRPFVVLIPQPI